MHVRACTRRGLKGRTLCGCAAPHAGNVRSEANGLLDDITGLGGLEELRIKLAQLLARAVSTAAAIMTI